MLRSAPLLRRGALLVRGPSFRTDGARLCGAALRAAPRPGHENAESKRGPKGPR